MKNKQTQYTLNESGIGIVVSIGAIWFLTSFIIPFLSKMWFNFLMTRMKTSIFDKNLTDEIQSLTNLPVNIYVINDTKNYDAFHAGTKSIYISKALLNDLTHREAIAVLLHETGHYVNNDSNRVTYMYMPINKLILFLLFAIALASIPIAVILFFISESLFIKFLSKRSHRAEFLADSFASELGYGKELISALNKFFNKIKEDVCKESKDKQVCEIDLFDYYQTNKSYTSHPDFFEREININSEELKYTKLALKDGKFKYIKKSYFELKRLFKKINEEIKIEEEKIRQKNLEYRQKKGL